MPRRKSLRKTEDCFSCLFETGSQKVDQAGLELLGLKASVTLPVLFLFCFVFEAGSYGSSGCPQIHYVTEVGLDSPASTSQLLG